MVGSPLNQFVPGQSPAPTQGGGFVPPPIILGAFCANGAGVFGPGAAAPVGTFCRTPFGPGQIVNLYRKGDICVDRRCHRRLTCESSWMGRFMVAAGVGSLPAVETVRAKLHSSSRKLGKRWQRGLWFVARPVGRRT